MVVLHAHRRVTASSTEPRRQVVVATKPRHVIPAKTPRPSQALGHHRGSVPGMSVGAFGAVGGKALPAGVPAATSRPAPSAERAWDIPHGLRMKLASWGPALLQRVTARFHSWRQQHAKGHGVSASMFPSRGQLVIGTDCSGAEAPIWSLRSMGIPYTHAFSCDLSPSVRKFIAQCSPLVGPVYDDMLRRDPKSLPPHTVYVCGFPCKPFSLLRRHSTKLMREPQAKPFFATVKVIKEQLPPVAILENVLGMRQVMQHVVSYFVRLRWYHVLVIPIDSAELGEPVRRPRYYFVLVRKDVALMENRGDLENFAKALLVAARTPCKDTVAERMLPASHPVVHDFMAKFRSAAQKHTMSPNPGKPRWVEHNTAYSRTHGLRLGSCGVSVSSLVGLRSARTRSAWALLIQKHASSNLVADLSQNVHRAPVCVDGSAPTITPGGIIAVRKLDRIMLPPEKLLVHNFPLHKMPECRQISDTDLESLGGNTMHLASVGVALLIGMAAVNWSAAGAQIGQKPSGTMPSAEAAIYIGSAAPARPVGKRRIRMPARSMKVMRLST